MSRRVLVASCAAGAAAIAVCALAAMGSSDPSPGSDAWVGLTGRVDPSATADKAAMTPDDAVAVRLLARSATAASSVAYAGTVVLQDADTRSTTQLLHVPGTGTAAVPQGTAASKAVLMPDGRSNSFADEGRQLDLLRINYRVLREADLDTTVAGRPAEAVVAVGSDGAVAARYWLDATTGLLLRKELVDAAGAVWSRSGFEKLSLDTASSPLATAAATPPADSWTQSLDLAALVAERTKGCDCPESLPGGLSLVEARRAPAGTVASVPVIHQLFSDGLLSVSLFTLPGTLADSDIEGLQNRGFVATTLDGYSVWIRGGATKTATATVVWQCGGSVLTLVTDGALQPREVAGTVVSAMPPSPTTDDSSFLDRVVRGWHKLTGNTA